MLYEIHMLKNYPPVNLNRDDTGSPKTCYFGGTQRGRISSQCLKRSWRTSPLFVDEFKELGIRTRHLPDLIGDEFVKRGLPDEMIEETKLILTGFANKDSKTNKDNITSQIVFYSPNDIKEIADEIEKKWKSNPDIKDFKKTKAKDIEGIMQDNKIRPITMDIALFGRMVTSNAFENVESATQVANAISTHTVNQESDYYTAMDDMLHNSKSEEAVTALIGETDYNACCYYHYMSIDTDQLKDNLKNSPDAENMIDVVLPTLIEVMAYTNPSGKQNSFAGNILPDMICVEVKAKKIPCSYVNAFAEPVRFSGNKELVKTSVQKLSDEINLIDESYGLDIKHRGWFAPRFNDISPKKAEVKKSLNELVTSCKDWAKEE
ncbi:MAG: type I-E CRISPR-associated protein Cas7/Cse4/CasC [Solobacterium sp.]|jgi:CRISPR system Cascade subunit CasC|nr:type I-E CRISPR-associated protein Cas7/Cse4/CasC [Solobacterium sp.]MCH4222137.1 type I-E CRISPR-associated protein Cas7/Cse4/CasC [Solobacterium sp.]